MNNQLTPDQEQYILDNYENLYIKAMVKELGVRYHLVYYFMRDNNLTREYKAKKAPVVSLYFNVNKQDWAM